MILVIDIPKENNKIEVLTFFNNIYTSNVFILGKLFLVKFRPLPCWGTLNGDGSVYLQKNKTRLQPSE